MTESKRQIDKIVDRLIEGRLIFFFGAGISMGARIPSDDNFEPTIDWMKAKVWERVQSAVPGGRIACDGHLRHMLDSNDPDGEQSDFGNLVELVEWIFGQKVVCDTLRISDFAELRPLSAHYYVAWLARERLIQEVITTNYDCCIERAYLYSLGFDPDARTDRLSRIYSLESYREHGGRQQTAGFKGVFKVCKINGCANAYKNGDIDANHILLTERQLQRADGDSRRWVRDLLSDRARRRSICFVGFGSDEPQVRHTMLSVIEEFGDASSSSYTDSTEVPNAPFVAAYSDVTFTQAQLCWSFLKTLNLHKGQGLDQRIAAHVLDQTSAGELWGGNRLDADNLLALIYARAWHRRVKNLLSRNQPFYRWLQALVPNQQPWINLLRHWAGGPPQSMPWRNVLRVREGLDVQEDKPLYSTLAYWVASAYRPEITGSTHIYYSLRGHPFFILTLMLLILSLSYDAESTESDSQKRFQRLDESIESIPRVGLSIDLQSHNEISARSSVICVLALGSSAGPPQDPFAETDYGRRARFVVRIGIPDHYLSHWRWSRRSIINSEHGGGHKSVSTWRIVAVDGSQLISNAETPEKVRSVIRQICARASSEEQTIRRRLMRR